MALKLLVNYTINPGQREAFGGGYGTDGACGTISQIPLFR